MEIIELPKDFDFNEIKELVIAEWPAEWGEKTAEEKLKAITGISDSETDVNKVLVEAGKKIGWYRYTRWPREESNKDKAHTLDIVIAPEYQGRGLGKLLMADLIEDCKARGYKKLQSRTFLNNESSIGLHKSTGFREAFRTEDSIVWELAL